MTFKIRRENKGDIGEFFFFSSLKNKKIENTGKSFINTIQPRRFFVSGFTLIYTFLK